MEQRERLIDILSRFHECLYDETMDCNECDYKDVGECCDTRLADYLLANGVVVLPCRCGECEHKDNELLCPSYHVWFNNRDNWFCADAKRKGGDK